MVTPRPETPADHAAVYTLHQSAFGQSQEANLVDRLRQRATDVVSLVAEDEAQIVGHILFSPVTIESDEDLPLEDLLLVMGLAPMAVRPERQRQGIGSTLVRDGLRACKREGAQAVVVLGHPDYYPRFGFRPAESFGLRSEYDVPREVFMALELEQGALREMKGVVTYHAAFAAVT